jgi:hypothetical protein
MNINWDRLAGRTLGVIFVVVMAKVWLAPDMSIWEILKIIVKGEIGWWW